MNKKIVITIGFSWLVLIILMISNAKAESKTDNLPQWVFEGTRIIQNRVVAVGIGDGKVQALSWALVEFSEVMGSQLKIEDSARVSKSVTKTTRSFGKVKLQAMTVLEQKNASADIVSIDSKIVFDNPPKHYEIKYFCKDVIKKDSQITLKYHFEVNGTNCTLQDLIEELKSNGIDIETFATADAYYVKLESEIDKTNSSAEERTAE